ncbi:MAG: nucleotidyltransferase family protein [Oscillospiraceae bacterium]
MGALAELLQAPNNILAVEYLKAIFDQRLDLHPLTILRTGAQHDRPAEGNVRSASELRTRIGAGRERVRLSAEGGGGDQCPGKEARPRAGAAGGAGERNPLAPADAAARRFTTRCPARPRGRATVCTAPRTRSRRSTAYSRRQNPSATRSRASGA